VTAPRDRDVYSVLAEAGAIERKRDYVLPCGLHSDAHINLGEICRSEDFLRPITEAVSAALGAASFDTVVSTGWAMSTVARRLILAHQIGRRRRVRHVTVEGYETPTLLSDLRAGATAVVLLDVVVTGGLFSRVTAEIERQRARIVKAIALVDAGWARGETAVPWEILCRVPMDVRTPEECQRCGVLPRAEFNPISYSMTEKKATPRSPSAFLGGDAAARELWELVDRAGAYEHHRVIGKRHYVGFVDTVQLLGDAETGPSIVDKLCGRIAARSGIPDAVLVPARARGFLVGRRLVERFEHTVGPGGVRLVPARKLSGYFTVGSAELARRRVLVADVAAGQGETIDELTLLALDAGAASVAGAVVLSRLSESCENALDSRLSGGFVRLYSLPIRPITVYDKGWQRCPVCRRREELRETLAQLPSGPAQELARQLAAVTRFPRWRRKAATATARQIPLFRQPFFLAECRRGVASGIALHALHAAAGDGMAPLSLPEISDDTIPRVNRVAMLEDLPGGVLGWSGEPLENDLIGYLEAGSDWKVWAATADVLAREGSTVWVGYLKDAIRRAAQRQSWMDDRFWASMVCAVNRVVQRSPEVRRQVEAQVRELVKCYEETPAAPGLQAMLALV